MPYMSYYITMNMKKMSNYGNKIKIAFIKSCSSAKLATFTI